MLLVPMRPAETKGLISRADGITDLSIFRRRLSIRSSVRPSTALNRYSSFNSYWIILIFLQEKLGI